MISVSPQTPTWVPLGQGVRVLLIQAGEVELATARAWARRAMEQIEAIEALPNAPLMVSLNGEEKAVLERDAVRNGLLARGLARLCIREWEGVEGDCTPAGAAALVEIDGMAAPFLEGVLRKSRLVATEGNASGPGPNGTSEAGPDTAKDAAPQD